MGAQSESYTFNPGEDQLRKETEEDYKRQGWSFKEIPDPGGSGAITVIFTPPEEAPSTFVASSSPAATATTVASSMSSSSAEELVLHPKIKAMLEVLAFTEGTGNNYGKVVNGTVISSPHHPELVGKKNVSVTDLSQHPNIMVQVNATIKSTAAGRYQFLKRTWDGLGMPDFQAKSQDIAAVKLMKKRGMIEPLLTDNLRQAVFNGAPEWASLPTEGGGSYYGGQPARTITEIEKKYKEALA